MPSCTAEGSTLQRTHWYAGVQGGWLARTSGSRFKPRNRILASLPAPQLKRITKNLELVELESSQILFDQGRPIANVHFVETGVASVVGIMSDGSAVETATIGYEGMVGLPLFHGVTRSAAQAFCQVPGTAYRMSSRAFQAEIRRDHGALTEILGRYTEALFTMVAQSAACNRVHPVRERCARWLLQTHDRVAADEFSLTHRFLAQMLGVRRASVTDAVGTLRKAGIVEYKMGRMRILDRRKLERSACECYEIITSEFDRLLNNRRHKSPLSDVKTASGGQSLAKPPRVRLNP